MSETIEHSTASQTVRYDAGRRQIALIDNRTGQVLLSADAAGLMRPVLDGQTEEWRLRDVRSEDGGLVLAVEGPRVADARIRIALDERDDAVDFQCEFTCRPAGQLNRLELLPPGTLVTAYDLVNFRNRNHTPNTWPELLIGGAGCETDTYSTDWQFAPHPTMFLFRKLATHLFAGTLDLPQSFGMYFAAADYRVKHWYLDYGSSPFGQPMSAGERYVSPRLRLFTRAEGSVWGCVDEFARMLVGKGLVADPARKEHHRWWREPLYCTWGDQGAWPEVASRQELGALADMPERDRVLAVLTEDLVRRAADTIVRQRLPFRTILIDDGWQVSRGQWDPHPERFPNFRGLVDDLHAAGFRVVVWWTWAEILPDARVEPRHLIGGGKLNKHGARMRDYSLPATQEEYLRPLLRKLFSSEPGCYDLDGYKSDFLADKVHPDMPVHDPAWRGEEMYIARLTRLIGEQMRLCKPDAVHIGCAGNFHLAEWIDINRTYDVCSSNPLEHRERARMLQHTAPGCPAAYDFHDVRENQDLYFSSALEIGASVQIGKVLAMRRDPFTAYEPADEEHYAYLREKLAENARAVAGS